MKYRLAILVEFEAPSYSEAVHHAENLINILLAHPSYNGETKVLDTVGPDIISDTSCFRPNAIQTITFPRA